MQNPAQGGRTAPLEMSSQEFRDAGHRLVDRIAEFLEQMPNGPVTNIESPAELRALLGPETIPENASPAGQLIDHATELLVHHSLFNGHPRFWGFITSSAAPIGALGDMLAAAVNPNLGGWILSPVASEIERQTVRWIAELIGFAPSAGGILTSGGNIANMVGFWVGRRVKTPWDLREQGFDEAGRTTRVYVSAETHTWVQKAADLSGLGTNAIRWIPTDHHLRMDTDALRRQIDTDLAAGDLPLMVVGTGGSVSTGTIDPLREIARICQEHDLWFHIDGAYGAPAAALPEADDDFEAVGDADSVAIDPHKWLYAPLEAGCALVRDAQLMRDTFSFHPPYYPEKVESADDAPIFYHEFGPQNSRGFRALKVWLGIRQAGRQGLIRMIRDDIGLARRMYERALEHDDLEAVTLGLSIATFRFVPGSIDRSNPATDAYLDDLNRQILDALQNGGEAFITNAVIDDRFVLRACVVNFRTDNADVDALMDLVVRLGHEADSAARPDSLRIS